MPRERLPNRRVSESFGFECNGLQYTATISRFDDGRIAEVFIGNHKNGSDADTAARDSGIVASLALQHGVPLDTLRKALLRDSHGRANGPLGAALDILAGRFSHLQLVSGDAGDTT
jgi:ribonucleoside-diphosphate reductase alpha chain